MIANVVAEKAVIGAALLGGLAGVKELSEDDFTDARHRAAAVVLRDCAKQGLKLDPILAVREIERRGQLSAAGGGEYLRSLAEVEATPVVASATYYAQAVREATRCRLTDAAGSKLATAARKDGAAELLEELIANHSAELAAIPAALGDPRKDAPPTMSTLLTEEFHHRWLFPGLIARGERIVIAGPEGQGKSYLLSQIVYAGAAGLHPFTGERCGPPVTVLVIDCENSREQTKNRYEDIAKKLTKGVAGWANRVHPHIRPEGLDLPGRDRGWFSKVAADVSPDLIVIGPAYKVMRGDPQRDNDVLALLSVIDEIRVKHDAAVILETHAGHGKDEKSGNRVMRPYGSSVWLRWPEIGIGLNRGPGDQGGKRISEFEVGHWRGMREERDWPELLERGLSYRPPWSPVHWQSYLIATQQWKESA
jgi:AAA domain/DnaB-like helicase N terminal domain